MNIDSIDKNLWTPLHIACLYNNVNIVDYILKRNFDSIKCLDFWGWNCAHYASCAYSMQSL